MEHKMFCFQCEQTAGCTGCTGKAGVCGKTAGAAKDQDELTGALDTKSSGQVLKFVEKMNRQFGTTVVIITHNEAIAGMADQVIRLKDGQVSENLQNKRKIPAAELVL